MRFLIEEGIKERNSGEDIIQFVKIPRVPPLCHPPPSLWRCSRCAQPNCNIINQSEAFNGAIDQSEEAFIAVLKSSQIWPNLFANTYPEPSFAEGREGSVGLVFSSFFSLLSSEPFNENIMLGFVTSVLSISQLNLVRDGSKLFWPDWRREWSWFSLWCWTLSALTRNSIKYLYWWRQKDGKS